MKKSKGGRKGYKGKYGKISYKIFKKKTSAKDLEIAKLFFMGKSHQEIADETKLSLTVVSNCIDKKILPIYAELYARSGRQSEAQELFNYNLSLRRKTEILENNIWDGDFHKDNRGNYITFNPSEDNPHWTVVVTKKGRKLSTKYIRNNDILNSAIKSSSKVSNINYDNWSAMLALSRGYLLADVLGKEVESLYDEFNKCTDDKKISISELKKES